MLPDPDTLYASLVARDGRFEGRAFVCVRTTGIYCRLTCPARTPKRGNVSFRATLEACEDAGFRACKRCRPGTLIASCGRSSLAAKRRPTNWEG